MSKFLLTIATMMFLAGVAQAETVYCYFGNSNISPRKIVIDLENFSKTTFQTPYANEKNASVSTSDQWQRLTVTVEAAGIKIFAFYELKGDRRPYGKVVIIDKKTGVSYQQNTSCHPATDYLD